MGSAGVKQELRSQVLDPALWGDWVLWCERRRGMGSGARTPGFTAVAMQSGMHALSNSLVLKSEIFVKFPGMRYFTNR